MTGGAAPERWECSPDAVEGPGAAAGLVGYAAALGVRLEARPGGRLWADRQDLLPTALRDDLAAHRPAVVAWLAERQHVQVPPQDAPPLDVQRNRPGAGCLSAVADIPPDTVFTLPGVPPEWCRDVTLLASRPAPDTIQPRRWAILAATSARLLRNDGAALHGARWDAVALFGLHPTAPMTHPPGWCLAWLLGEHGEVLDVAADAVGLCRQPDGARLVCRRRAGLPPAGIVPAWEL